LAGKPAIFDVQVLEASKRIVPEVTDDFANKVRAGLTADSMMAELRKAIDEEDAKEFVPDRNKALGLALAEVFDVPVPDTLVTNQARERFAIMMADMRDNGVADEVLKNQINPENFLKYKNIVKPEIEREFKISMATDEIARLENINVPAYLVEEQMESIRNEAREKKEEFDENMIKAKVETTLQRQAVMSWLAERAEIEVEYKEEVFDEDLMRQIAKDSLEREKELMGADVDVDIDAAIEGKTDLPADEATSSAEVSNDVVATQPAGSAVLESPPAAATAPVEEDEEARQARYAAMSVEDRAYQILKDLGTIDRLN
jgi:FKBP-type peptidyl-prolyl cis-trans isomerase (trigger factor)